MKLAWLPPRILPIDLISPDVNRVMRDARLARIREVWDARREIPDGVNAVRASVAVGTEILYGAFVLVMIWTRGGEASANPSLRINWERAD